MKFNKSSQIVSLLGVGFSLMSFLYPPFVRHQGPHLETHFLFDTTNARFETVDVPRLFAYQGVILTIILAILLGKSLFEQWGESLDNPENGP
jgi:hypothetical protein